MNFPTILSAQGRIIDGMHRVAKAVLLGHATISAVQFEVGPKPGYVGIAEHALRY